MLRDPEYSAALKLVKDHKRARQRETKAQRLARAREHLKAVTEGQRKPRARDNAHLAFIRRLPCIATYMETGQLVYGVDACHVRFADAASGKPFTGAGRKPDDRWTVPMVRAQHERQHSMSERVFYERLGVDAIAVCKGLYAVSGNCDRGFQVIRAIRLSRGSPASPLGRPQPFSPEGERRGGGS